LIHRDPYGAGWICVIAPMNRDADLARLAHGEALAEQAERRIRLEPVDDWIKPGLP
jgi:glycine cleavage system H protein